MKLPYAIVIKRDECGGRPCYMAIHPELDGCMSQGDTPAEAVANLHTARADYIAALLEDGVPVPLPKELDITTESAGPSSTIQLRLDQTRAEVVSAINGSLHRNATWHEQTFKMSG